MMLEGCCGMDSELVSGVEFDQFRYKKRSNLKMTENIETLKKMKIKLKSVVETLVLPQTRDDPIALVHFSGRDVVRDRCRSVMFTHLHNLIHIESG